MYHLPDRLFELIRLCGDDQFHRKKGTCHQIRYLLHLVGSLSGRCEERLTDEGIWSLDKNRNRRNNYRTFVLNFQILVQVRYLTADNDNVAPIPLDPHMPPCATGQGSSRGEGEKRACGPFLSSHRRPRTSSFYKFSLQESQRESPRRRELSYHDSSTLNRLKA